MKRIILITLFFLVSVTSLCYSLDWKNLHEEADKKSLNDVLVALKTNPDSLENLYVLGLVYLNLHKDKEARSTFDKILLIKPEAYEARWGVAEALRREHKAGESEKIAAELIKAHPDFYPAYVTLSFLKYNQMNFNEAVRLAAQVLDQSEKKVDTSNRARAYLMVGGSKGMLAHYGGPFSKIINGTAVLFYLKKAQQLQPDSAGVMFGLGSFYLLAPSAVGGDLEEAEKYLKRGITIDPLFADIYVRLGQVYKIKGDLKKYNFYLNKALEIDPQSELALDVKSGTCKFVCLERPE